MPKVIVADDDPILRAFAEALFNAEGFDCLLAADGAEAIKLFERDPPDLAVLDMIMPNQDGIETLRAVKARWPRTRVIVISGGTESMDSEYLLRMARNLGADAICAKPLRSAAFLPVVREVLAAVPPP